MTSTHENDGSKATTRRSLRLTSKLLIILLAAVLVWIAITLTLQQSIVYPIFLSLEEQEARQDLQRVVEALNAEIEHLDTFVHDWSAWDDTYDFVETLSEDYIEASLTESTFLDNDLSVIQCCGADGSLRWGEVRLPGAGGLPSASGWPSGSLPPSHPFVRHSEPGRSLQDASVSGIHRSVTGPVLVAARSILQTDNVGPVRGFLVMGRALSHALVGELGRRTHVDLRAHSLLDGSAPDGTDEIVSELQGTARSVVRPEGRESLHV